MSDDRQSFVLVSDAVRGRALVAVRQAPTGYRVTIMPPGRSGSQSDLFHALCSDLAASPMQWAGKRRDKEQWKALMVSGHAQATGAGGDIVPGIEGEFVAIRESTSRMSSSRANSLIEYVMAFCATNGVELRSTREGGYL